MTETKVKTVTLTLNATYVNELKGIAESFRALSQADNPKALTFSPGQLEYVATAIEMTLTEEEEQR